MSLKRLLTEYPLGPRWETPSTFIECADVLGVRVQLAGLVARNTDGSEATGSAADPTRVPLRRAYWELVERATVWDAMCAREKTFELRDATGTVRACGNYDQVFPESPPNARWTYSRSNGVAAGGTFSEACRFAFAELVERDRVLRSWFGHGRTKPVALPAHSMRDRLRTAYDFRAYLFPPGETRSVGSEFEAAAVFGFPIAPDVPLVFGTAASRSSRAALTRAWRECIQRLGFLWGEPIPTAAPDFARRAEYHQEFYLWPASHERLRAWLDGMHASQCHPLSTSPDLPASFVDLTPAHLKGRLHVVKAVGGDALPLVFGEGHPRVPAAAQHLQVHPLA